MDKTYFSSDLNISSIQAVNSGLTKKMSLRLGQITSVNTEENTVSLDWIFPMQGGIQNVEISRPYVGLKSGIHFIPEIGSLVVVGFIEELPILLTYSLPTQYQLMLSRLKNDDDILARIRKLNPGEISLNSAQNSEIYLSDSITISDRTKDKIKLNPNDGSIEIDSLQFYVNNDAGKLFMGTIERNEEIIGEGEKALNEFKLTINKYSDSTVDSNEKIADITIGTIVDDSGNKIKSSDNNDIQLQISMPNGVKIDIDSAGKAFMSFNKLNINNGNEVIPNSISGQSQQRAAREGDRIIIQLTPPLSPNTIHPGLNSQSVLNLAQLQLLASCIVSPVGPCTFVPVPGLSLVGEITQGSNEVFIGSNDKTKETTESNNNTLN